MKKLLAMVLVLMMALTSFVCPAMAEEDKTIIAALLSDPVSYNPNTAMDDPTLMVLENVFSKLIKFDYAGNLMPDLAKSWEVSEDGLNVTFALQEGVQWHDGTPFTSADVAWSLEKIAQEGFSADYLSNMVACETPDDNTVVVTLAQPDSSLIYNMAYYGMYILPKHLYEGQDWLTCEAATVQPVGTGAYKLVDHQRSVSVTLQANPDYFGGAPKCGTVIYSIIPDVNTAVQALRNGEIDYLGTYAPASEIANLAAEGMNVNTRAFASRYYICLNMREGRPFVDYNVRLAIAKAIDREEILAKGLSGVGAVAEGFAPIAIEWAYNSEDVVPEKDVEGAIALLEGAGLTRDADGYFMTLTCPTMPGAFTDVTTVVKAQLKEIGINLQMNNMDEGAFAAAVMAENPDFDLTIISGYHGPDASAMANRVGTNGMLNLMGYSNADVDACYANANLSSDTEERAKYFKQAQKILSEELPIVPLCESTLTEVSASYLVNTPFSAPELSTIGEFYKTDIQQ